MEWKIGYNIRKCILMGDLNSQPGDSFYTALVGQGLWSDLMASDESPRPPTYISPTGASTMDHLLGDEEIAACTLRRETAGEVLSRIG